MTHLKGFGKKWHLPGWTERNREKRKSGPRSSHAPSERLFIIILNIYCVFNLYIMRPVKLATHVRRPPGTVGHICTEVANLYDNIHGH